MSDSLSRNEAPRFPNDVKLPLLPISPPKSPSTDDTTATLPEQTNGILLTFLASLGFSALALCVRLGTTRRHLSVPLFAFARGVTTFASASTFLCLSSTSPPKTLSDAAVVTLRGLIGATSMVCRFEALSRLPLPEAVAISFTSQAITLALTHLFLADKVWFIEVFACTATLSAAVLISLAPDASTSALGVHRLSGVAFAAAAALCQGTCLIITRRLGKRVHSQWNVLSLGFCSAVVGLFLIGSNLGDEIAAVTADYWSALPPLAGASFFSYLGSSSINHALQLLAPGSVSVLRSTEIPLSYSLAFIFLGETIDSWQSSVGVVVIALSTIALGWSRASKW